MGVVLGNIDEGLNDGLPGEYVPVDPGLPPVNITAPVISGTARVGETLHVTDGTWQYNPFSFLYQWRQDGGTNCVGATSTTADYEPNVADAGFELYCSIVAQNSAGDSLEVDSDNSDEVAAGFTYLRPGGSFTYKRPGGVDTYLRP